MGCAIIQATRPDGVQGNHGGRYVVWACLVMRVCGVCTSSLCGVCGVGVSSLCGVCGVGVWGVYW